MSIKTKTTDAAENSITKVLEQTDAVFSDGMARVSAGIEQSQAKITEGLEKTRKAAEQIVAFGQGNIEALTKSTQIWAASVRDLSERATAAMQASFQETVSVIKTLGSVKSLKEAIDVQSGLARTTVEKTLSEAGRLTEASLKLTEQALAPMTARISAAVETFSKAA